MEAVLLNYDQARKVFDSLSIGYRKVENRLSVLGHNKEIKDLDNDEIDNHALLEHITEVEIPNVEYFINVDAQTRELLKTYIEPIDQIVKNEATFLHSFYVMSSSWNNAKRFLKHVHTLIQDNPRRCITWTFPIILYRDPNELRTNKFFYNPRKDLYPKIVYHSYHRMEKQDVEMLESQLSMNTLMSFCFDASRMLHYVNHTNNLVLWKVFDGVQRKTKDPLNELIIDFHYA